MLYDIFAINCIKGETCKSSDELFLKDFEGLKWNVAFLKPLKVLKFDSQN